MLAYPIEEAQTLLTSKLSAAKQSYSNCEEDLDFLREQITVSALFHLTSIKGSHITNIAIRLWRSQ